MNNEKLAKQFELQLSELQSKCDEQSRQLMDFTSMKGRMHNENSDLVRQLEDAESQVSVYRCVQKKICAQQKSSFCVKQPFSILGQPAVSSKGSTHLSARGGQAHR